MDFIYQLAIAVLKFNNMVFNHIIAWLSEELRTFTRTDADTLVYFYHIAIATLEHIDIPYGICLE